MPQYTFGGTPADVLTDTAGNVIPNYLVLVYRAGTNELVSALYEANGTTPISELRTNAVGTATPGAIRTFKADDVIAIEYQYNGPGGVPVRWYQAARELAEAAAGAAGDALSKSEGGTVTAPVALDGGASVEDGLDVTGGITADGATINGDLTVTGSFTPTSLQLSGMRIYNPRVYGALGNGTGNDATAIQAALTAARNAGGGWVLVPSGTYMIGATLRIYASTRLTLMPGCEFRRNVAATMLLNGDADQNQGGYTGQGDILVEGGLWNMRGTTSGLTASAMCISIGHARNITIRDIEVRDLPGYHAIELNSTQTGRVLDSKFRGYIDPGSRDFSEAIQIDLAKGSGYFGGFGPYDNTSCQDIEIRGCYFGPSGTGGTVAWPRGIGSHSATIGTRHSGIRIIGNTFDSGAQYAIGGYDWRDVVIDSNTINGCGAGVRMRVVDTGDTNDTLNTSGVQTSASQDMRNITISDNVFRGTTGHDDAILLLGESTGKILNTTVTGNTIDGVTSGSQNGIRCEYAEQYTVTGNTVRDVAGTGISQQNITGATVTGNRIYTPTSSGISCDTGTGVLIGTNTIRDPGVNGIHVLGGSDVQLISNYIKGASRASAGSYGIRVSTSTDGLLVTGNKVRKFGSGNEAAYGLSITSTCTNVRRYGNDLRDSGTSGMVDDQTTGPELSPFDNLGNLEELMRPSGRYETTSRLRSGGESQPTSGWLYLVPIWLPQGLAVSNITFVSGNTAGATLTNQWFTLHNSSRVALARTADATTAAWAASTAKTLAVAQTTAGSASSYTTTYSGLHYLGFMIAATTLPSLIGEGRLITGGTSSPGLGATNSGQTTPPTVTAGAFTAASFAGSAILAYGYTT